MSAPWPRGIRARLLAVYTVAAVLLAVAGVALFVAVLHRGLNASLADSLQTRAASVAASLEGPGANAFLMTVAQRGASAVSNGSDSLDSFLVIYRPDGQVGAAQTADAGAQAQRPILTPAQLAQARQRSLRLTESIGESRFRLLAVAVPRPDGQWVVAVGASTSATSEAANKAIHPLVIAVPLLIVLAAFGAWLLSGAALRPVERMRRDAEDIGEHDPANRLSVPATADELARLARTFNALLDRLHRSVARQRDLVADAGHELRTPLSVLRTELDLADRPGRSRDELADAVGHARHEVIRLSQLADDLLFLARADGAAPIVSPENTDLSALLADAARSSRARAESLGIEIVVDKSGLLTAWADPSALRRAVDNLIANALDVSAPGGTVTLACGALANGDRRLTVTDNGPGFPGEFLPHAFERFRRADTSRTTTMQHRSDGTASVGARGAGLGLAIVAEIARAHGGAVAAANTTSGGAVVTMTLPDVRRSHPIPT